MANQNLRNRYLNDGAGVTSQARLLVMLFDRLVADVRNSITAVDRGEIEVVNKKLCNAQAILLELHAALDVNAWPNGAGLSQLYLWLSNELMAANIKKDAGRMKDCLRMLEELNGAWKMAYEETQNVSAVPPMPSVPPIPSVPAGGVPATAPAST